jgi:formate dehydrogenase
MRLVISPTREPEKSGESRRDSGWRPLSLHTRRRVGETVGLGSRLIARLVGVLPIFDHDFATGAPRPHRLLDEAEHQPCPARDHQDQPDGVDADVGDVHVGGEVEDCPDGNQEYRASNGHWMRGYPIRASGELAMREDHSMANVLCVLYEDPVDGYPPSYARDEVPAIERYHDGQSAPTPESIGFKPGDLLGSVSGELGLREFLEGRGHRLVVTSDKDGPDSVFERELPEAEIVISQPFWPAYLTAERIAKTSELKLALTAGIGSDHVDLQAAIEHGLTVAEVTYSNSISVAEHVVMMILSLVRNYIPSHQWVLDGGWNIADCVSRSYDLEGMQVGTVAAGRIGSAVLRRLKPFEVGLHYTDRHRLPAEVEEELGVTFHPNVESLVEACDVVTINAPLHPETENLFDADLLARMKRGSYLINTARGKICDRDAVARACESGQLAGYAGDVWFPQPAPKDHLWRSMPPHGMTPHTSGTSLSAQARYAAGTREILECWFDGRPIREEYLIVDGGTLAGAGAHSYSEGDATGGSEEATRFTSG